VFQLVVLIYALLNLLMLVSFFLVSDDIIIYLRNRVFNVFCKYREMLITVI